MSTRVLRVRIKDRHAKWLSERAREVNQIWNFVNELSQKVWVRERRSLSGFDFWPYLKGATKEGIALPVQTVQEVAEQYAVKRRCAEKTRLAWRKSGGARRSLAWLPFKVRTIRYRAGQVCYAGKWLGLWDSYGLSQYELRAGSISEDARGRWCLNVCVERPNFVGPCPKPTEANSVGIDLGLKTLAAFSEGEPIEAPRFYRDLEPALAIAQRAGKEARVKAIHAKIANRRKDFLHKHSTRLVRQHRAIFVGNVNAAALANTPLAKSVLDAGWSAFRTMLQYKGDDAGAWLFEHNEAFSTQDCSACSARTGPKGLAELGVRRWTCSSCGVEHDRDQNSGASIKRWGVAWFEKEYSAAGKAKAFEVAVNKGQRPSSLRPGPGRGPLAAGIPFL